MATVWLTYAWGDNAGGDVDFIAQELVASGLGVKLDRWNITAGRRLWDQIAYFIQDARESDAWVLLATQNSLGSQPCREEFAYALDRALSARGIEYPIIGLFPATVDTSLVPASVRVRLCVSETDPDWKERIKAAAEGRPAGVARPHIEPFQVRSHVVPGSSPPKYALEVRPRAGSWAPFFAAIPIGEKEVVKPRIMHGPANRVPTGGMMIMTGDVVSDDGRWWIMFAHNEATPTLSYYVFVEQLPSELVFGVHNGQPQYRYLVRQPGE